MSFVIKSFFATWAILRISNLHTMNVISVLFFVMSMVFFKKTNEKIKTISQDVYKKQSRLSMITAGVFTLFYMIGAANTILSDMSNVLFRLVILAAVAIGLFGLLYDAILFGFAWFGSTDIFADKPMQEKTKKWLKRMPVICFFACLLCWLPYFLYAFPAIMTPDSIRQLEQILGQRAFSNHHPWVHTMTMSLFYHFGSLFTDSVNGAFAFFTVFQMCFMAFAASFCVWIVSKFTQKMPVLIGITVFYACVPYNAVMSICIWKDVMFSGSVLIFCCALFYLLFGEKTKKMQIGMTVIYVVTGILFCLYRSNGWYAFILCVPFLVFVFRKNWKVMLPLHVLIVAVVLLVKGPVMDACGVTQPDFVESVSMPLQMIGRVIAEGNELTAKQEASLNKIMDVSAVPETYVGFFSDNMKNLVRDGNQEYLTEHKGEFFKVWLELGLKYPDTYLAAYINQTYGYFAPTAVYPVMDVEGIIDNEAGVYTTPLIRGVAVTKIREIFVKIYNVVPLYGILSGMASLLWITCLFMVYSAGIKKESFKEGLSKFILFLPNLAIIATLFLATPVANEFRYAYNLAYCLPLYVGVFIHFMKKTN